MEAGQVFLGDYTDYLRLHPEQLPSEAKEGPYAIGAILMVSREAMAADYRIPDLPEWFPARVCLPPPVAGQWYRWYDPFVWFESDVPIHTGAEHSPSNMAYTGKLWSPGYYRESRDQWAYPIAEWRRLFGGEA